MNQVAMLFAFSSELCIDPLTGLMLIVTIGIDCTKLLFKTKSNWGCTSLMLTENVSDLEAVLEATEGQGFLKQGGTCALWKTLKGATGFCPCLQ